MKNPKEPINKTLSDIQGFVNILEDLNGKKKYTNYNTLCKDLLENFGIKIKIEEIRELYEPTVEELTKDLEIMYRNGV